MWGQIDGWQAREKSRTYVWAGLHPHEGDQNENPILFGFPYATETTGVIDARDLAIDLYH